MLNSFIFAMEPVKQEDPLGCAIACVAYTLRINYKKSLTLFENGFKKANATGFLCKEIVMALAKTGLRYENRYVGSDLKKKIYRPNTFVFLRRSKRYPEGHYLVRSENNNWMDPWINFPNEEIKAGYRTRLPEKPIYAILQIE